MSAARTEEKPAASRRWVLIGGGLGVAVVLAALLASTASVDSFLYLGLDTLKRGTLARLAPDVAPGLRDELRRAFDCVTTAATSGRVAENDVGRFARACRAALADDVVDRAEAADLRDRALDLCGGS